MGSRKTFSQTTTKVIKDKKKIIIIISPSLLLRMPTFKIITNVTL